MVSGGRLIFGLGIGYLKPEFDALGIPFEDRGARTIDYLQAMLAVWTQEKPTYAGRFLSFRDIRALPQPVQRPHPPIVVGGATPAAFRRAVRHANGWYGFALELAETVSAIAALRRAEERHGRPPHLGSLEISVTPRGRFDADLVRRFADAGVHRLIPALSMADTEADVLRFVDRAATVMAAS